MGVHWRIVEKVDRWRGAGPRGKCGQARLVLNSVKDFALSLLMVLSCTYQVLPPPQTELRRISSILSVRRRGGMGRVFFSSLNSSRNSRT